MEVNEIIGFEEVCGFCFEFILFLWVFIEMFVFGCFSLLMNFLFINCLRDFEMFCLRYLFSFFLIFDFVIDVCLERIVD